MYECETHINLKYLKCDSTGKYYAGKVPNENMLTTEFENEKFGNVFNKKSTKIEVDNFIIKIKRAPHSKLNRSCTL